MSKEIITDVSFIPIPEVKIRVITKFDSKDAVYSKKKYPFELCNDIVMIVCTDKRTFKVPIYKGFTWNGADIPRLCWRLVGSRTDNDFLIASMAHDYLLDFKQYVLKEILKDEISMAEYRRLTSLIFRQIIKDDGTNILKANVMAWCVDVFQMLKMKG